MENNQTLDGTTPLDDYSGLRLGWINNRSQLDAAEAESIQQVLKKHLFLKQHPFPHWFTVDHFNRLHKEMFGKIWQWAGKYRKTGKSIGIESFLISIEMRNLEDDIAFWGSKSSTLNPIEVSARVHHRLVWIHPYENGNGRLARLIGDMLLVTLGYSYPQWPILKDDDHERMNYLKALREADGGHFDSLQNYLIEHGATK